MKKITIILILTFFLGGIFFRNDFLDFYSKLTLRLPQVEKKVFDLVQKAEKQIVATPALRAKQEAHESFLTQAGIIEWTNIQREKKGLPLLKENQNLNVSAKMKAEDMLKEQYFEHVSLKGEEVSDLAEIAGYQFITIGENLAFGNFENDEILVQGWMDSPGHRENILNLNYQEIGVAVLKGEFAGENTWLAVQHFALPLSVCPQPSEAISEEITANQTQLKKMENALKELQSEIKEMRPKWGLAYNEKVEQYNELVGQYDAFFFETQNLVDKYNNQVFLFNECVSGF